MGPTPKRHIPHLGREYIKTITDTTINKLIEPGGEQNKYTSPRWLALFLIYRFTAHLATDDKNGRTIGFYEAAKRAANDLGLSARDDAIEAMLKTHWLE